MRITIDIQILIEEIQKTNPNVDPTSLKATILDLIVDGKASVPAMGEGRAVLIAPTPKEEVVTKGYVDQQHVPAPKLAESEDGLEPMHSADDDPLAEIARVAMASPQTRDAAPASSPAKRVVVTQRITGPKAPIDRQAERESKEAKRKEIADFANLPSKELMARLTDTQLPKKKSGQNQYVDHGHDAGPAGDGDIEIG